MALSTRKIADSIEWAKRLSFNRNPVIGNSLEPALTSANIIAQVITSPPFEWWWNNEDLIFTCDPTPKTATSSAVAIAGGVLTVTAANTFSIGDMVFPSALAGGSIALNGVLIKVKTASPTAFTADVTLSNSTDTVGTFTGTTTQDYTVVAPEFSHIAYASVLDLTATGAPVKWFELETKNNLALETSRARPNFISPQSENSDGTMTFRVNSAPDKKYPVQIQVQLAAPQYTSINQDWGLPDFMQYIYDWGFLALMWQFADDPRSTYANNQFKAALLGRAEGLTEEQKNIFLNNWEALQQGFAMKLQQGIQARSV